MSTIPQTKESLHENGGKRTVTSVTLPAGASALPHYHTDYQEVFHVIEGELIVTIGNISQRIFAGNSSDVILPGQKHSYRNASKQNVILDIIVAPGHQGCETTNKLLQAMDKEDLLKLLPVNGGYNLLWLIIHEITNTIPTGVSGFAFSVLRFIQGRKKISSVKQKLIDRYVNATSFTIIEESLA